MKSLLNSLLFSVLAVSFLFACSGEDASQETQTVAQKEAVQEKTKEPMDHAVLENKDKCWECHKGKDDIMHDTEKNCPTCHQSTDEWIEGYAEFSDEEPTSDPREGVEAFLSWGEMVSTGEKYEFSEKKVKEWDVKLSKLKKVRDLPKGNDGSLPLEEGDAIYIKREGREDPIYKAVVKIFDGKPKKVLFSLDDDFGHIMENAYAMNDLENPILKEVYESGLIERGGAKKELSYAKYLIEIEEPSLAHPGKMIRKIIIDPTAKDYIYSGDAALGIPSDF